MQQQEKVLKNGKHPRTLEADVSCISWVRDYQPGATRVYTKSLLKLLMTACQGATKCTQLYLPNFSHPFKTICMKFLLQELFVVMAIHGLLLQ